MKKFKCGRCDQVQEVSLIKEINNPHLFGKKVWIKCDNCKKRNWHTVVKEDKE